MANAFDLVATIPAKACDWVGLRAAVRQRYIDVCQQTRKTPLGLDRFDAAKGLREVRFEIGATLNCIMDIQSTVSAFIAPSPETLAWGGFLGGETVSYNDEKQAELATDMLSDLVAQYRK